MLNQIKKLIYKLWFWYLNYVPIKPGKHRLSFLLHKNIGPAVYLFQGIKLALSPYEFFWKRYMTNNLNDPEVYYCIEQYLKEGSVFLDIGANIGVFSLLAASKKKAVVYSFEPSYRELSRFHLNISLNSSVADKITLIPYGLANSNKEMLFHLSPEHHSGMNSVLNLHDFTKENTKVYSRFGTLNSLIAVNVQEQVSLCKIDVEGFEVEVLKGLESSMSYLKKCIFVVEISPLYLKKGGYIKEEIYMFFEKWDYKGEKGMYNDERQYNEVFKKDTL